MQFAIFFNPVVQLRSKLSMLIFQLRLLTHLLLCCSLGKCWIFWCTLHSVALLNANIQIAAKLKVFSAMESNAGRVLLVAVFCVRKCGTSFKYMLALVKNQNAAYRGAGTFLALVDLQHFVTGQHDTCHFKSLQGLERAPEKIAAAI